MQRPAPAAPAQHDATGRPGGLRRRRGVAPAYQCGAPRPRATAVPVGPPGRGQGLHPPVVGRGARPRRRPPARRRTRADRCVPHQPRHPERELLRCPEGDPCPRLELRRQRRPDLPLPQHVRVEGCARCRCHDLFLHRLDRLRPDRVRRLERRQQPAGRDEVPVPRQEGRYAGRVRQPLPRAGDGAVLGAVQRRKRSVRHQGHRPVLPDQRRWRHRIPQRRAQAHGRQPLDRP